MIGRRTIDEIEVLTLSSGDPADLEVAFAPGAGMVGCSLRHRGEELLGQRGGLRRYVAEHSTMGIPLLHPWANRVGARSFQVAGREVNLKLPGLPLSFDQQGLPIHGLLSAAGGWSVEDHRATDAGGVLEASFDFAAHPGLMAAFPFPHELRLRASLDDTTLTMVTTVRASGDVDVPLAFGFHPYLRLPVERAGWEVRMPVSRRLELDDRMLPTGELETVRIEPGKLGSRTFDDGYLAPDGQAPFVLSGGGRRIELTVGEGYPYAQVYAPADDDVIAFEPMAAPTNALMGDGAGPVLVEPGKSFSATFSIAVLDGD